MCGPAWTRLASPMWWPEVGGRNFPGQGVRALRPQGWSTPRPSPVAPELKSLRGVEQDGHGSVIHQFYVHPFLEPAGLAAQARAADARHKVLVELTGLGGRGGSVERRSLSPADIAIERELGNHQYPSPTV